MTYNTIAASASDQAFLKRIAACAAQEGTTEDPMTWAMQHVWQIGSNTEIEASYAYAVGAGNENPGGDEGAITDAMILAQVQPIVLGTPVDMP